MGSKTNLVFILADQLRAMSLPLFGERQIETPHIDRLASEGVSLNQCISTCPVCTPYRAMLLTGRHPQTTGHFINSIRTRHTEISVADAFNNGGYKTAWIGKWHLHTGSWPANNVPDWVHYGRDRLGFQHWRAYNMHMVYFNGFINSPKREYDSEQWEGYETDALNRYAFEFLDECGEKPFALFLSPHMPHWGLGFDGKPGRMAPDKYFDRLPDRLNLPANVAEVLREQEHLWFNPFESYRNYLAMILALDDMLGDMLDYLDRTGRTENTLVVFTSDHGTQGGAHDVPFWFKKSPYEESLHVPCILRLPGVFNGGEQCDALSTPVDFFPSLCSLCDIPIPRSVEGYDLSPAWRGVPGSLQRDAVFCMNFGSEHDFFEDGDEWRGVRTLTHQFTRWLDGRVELYDLVHDPLEMHNLADDPEHTTIRKHLEQRLCELQQERGDELQPCSNYRAWVDNLRRPIRNAYGPLGDPMGTPDWSLLR